MDRIRFRTADGALHGFSVRSYSLKPVAEGHGAPKTLQLTINTSEDGVSVRIGGDQATLVAGSQETAIATHSEAALGAARRALGELGLPAGSSACFSAADGGACLHSLPALRALHGRALSNTPALSTNRFAGSGASARLPRQAR